MEKLAKNKEKYLTPKTIENLKDGAKTLDKSDKYGTLEQLIKLSPEATPIFTATGDLIASPMACIKFGRNISL